MAHHNADGSDPRASEPPTLHVARPPEDMLVDELTMLRAWLTYLRESAIYKVEGLDDDQLRWKPAVAANSLGGILMHAGYGERLWLRVVFAGEEMDMTWADDRYASTFEVPDGWGADDVIAFYRAETASTDAVLDAVTEMEAPSRGAMRPTNLRWILTHLVEDLARHVGHLDITRELIDGLTGR